MAVIFDPHFQALNSSGQPLAGAKLYFYQSATTTPIVTYQDSTALTPHANPVVADAAGLFPPIYLDGSNDYKIVLTTSAGTTVQTVDPLQIPSVGGAAQPASSILTAIDAAGIGVFSGFIYGVAPSSNAGDPTNDVDVSAGIAIDRTNSAFIELTGALTKRLDASWAVGNNQGGLDTGSIANTTYYVYLIKRTDTGVVDVILSANSVAPTMPTNYSLSRQVGSFLRAAGAIDLTSFTGAQYTLPSLYVPSGGRISFDRADVVMTATTNALSFTGATSGYSFDNSVIVTSTDAGATGGPSVITDRNSASPSASDALGRFVFRGRNSAGETFDYGYIQGEISSPTDGLERGAISIHLFGDTTDKELLRVDLASGVQNDRVTINGDLQTGTFSTTGASTGVAMRSAGILSSKAVTTGSNHLVFYNPNGVVGGISTSGTTTTYNTSSDERLKQNFTDFDAGAIIDQMTMYHYEWKAGGEGYGPKAQELEGVFPSAVTHGEGEPGDEDFRPYGWDASKIVPLLIREIQSLRARVAQLES